VLRTLAALVAAVSVPAFGAVSCASVIGVADDSDATAELCQLLDRCYGKGGLEDCDAHVGKRLDAASAAAKKSWLQAFGDTRCLSSCKAARGCLDRMPVCKPSSQDCDVNEECCGFTKGLASCDPTAGTCCHPRGVKCKKDDDCCSDAGRCVEKTGTCGGVVCKQSLEACTTDAECCTKICLPEGVCGETACLPDGFGCGSDLDCCNGFCNPNTGLCGKSECAGLTAPCSSPDECCDGACFFSPTSPQGVCSTGECQPDNLSCSSGEPCCSGFCHPTFLTCVAFCSDRNASCTSDFECCSGFCPGGTCACAPDGTTCTADVQCCSSLCLGTCQTTGCVEPGGTCSGGIGGRQCCSGACNAGTDKCTWACDANQVPFGCEHGFCEVGAPLDPSCGCLDATCAPDDSTCIATICAVDPFCCCSEWDGICINEAVQYCSKPCP